MKHTKLTKTLTISECNDGYWLWDETRGMNLSMRAKSAQDALIEAITYYQERLSKVEKNYQVLGDRVDSFVSHFIKQE